MATVQAWRIAPMAWKLMERRGAELHADHQQSQRRGTQMSEPEYPSQHGGRDPAWHRGVGSASQRSTAQNPRRIPIREKRRWGNRT